MASTDRFGGPGAWDAECDEEDRAYAATAAGMTCLDCAECVLPEGGPDTGLGWCMDGGAFVDGRETVEQLGLECFRGR